MNRLYKIEALLNLVNATNKKNWSNIDLTMMVKLPNSISLKTESWNSWMNQRK